MYLDLDLNLVNDSFVLHTY